MRINHNIAALNTFNKLSANQSSTQGSLEKLSSGLKINKAGDDAAGLAISEKMRGQIRGLDMASKNAQDGISLIQTAEGALNETHSILQRMRELATQSANDTNTDTDRAELQKEMDQLGQEIDRISKTTEFNTQSLLDGSFKGTFQIGANEGQSLDLSISEMGTSALGLTNSVELEKLTSQATTLKDGSYTVDGSKLLDSKGNEVGAIADGTVTLADGATTLDFTSTDALASGDTINISASGDTATLTKKGLAANTELGAGSYTIDGTNVVKDGTKVGTITGTTITTNDGDTVDMEATFGMNAGSLATGKTFEIKGVDVSNKEMASKSITSIDNAISQVSAERSKLGAYQNRLDHTINNLGTSSENLTAAESRIRDVNMAQEMMNFTKNNILSQAAQSMLAQANQQPQGVLQLLQ